MSYKSIPTRNLSGISWMIDTHVIDDPKFNDHLFKMYELGWIYLQTPDTVFNELRTRKDLKHRDELLDKRDSFSMPLGPHILGQSSLDFSIASSRNEESRIAKIHSALWKGRIFTEDCQKSEEGNRSAGRKVSDTLIVNCTIRYGLHVLVTNDAEVIEGAARVREEVGNFYAWNVESATLIALSAIEKVRKLRLAPSDRLWKEDLPVWP